MDDVFDLIQHTENRVRLFYESIMNDSDSYNETSALFNSSSSSQDSYHTNTASSSLDNTSMISQSTTEADVIDAISTTASAGSSTGSRRRDLINDFPDEPSNRVSNNIQPNLSVDDVPVDLPHPSDDQDILIDSTQPSIGRHNSVEILDEIVPIPIPQPADDEVIFVSSNIDYIDLCTPINNNRAASRNNRRSVPTELLFNNIENVSPPKRAAKEVAKVESNLSSSQVAGKETYLECAICLENMVKKLPTVTKCGHVFCSACIREALRLTKQCPICRCKQRAQTLIKLHV